MMRAFIPVLSVLALMAGPVSAQINRGAMNRGGGGMARPNPGAMQRPAMTPQAMNRPAPQMQRPTPQMQRPTPQIQRPAPSMPQMQRPTPNLPQTPRPGNVSGFTRPATPTPAVRPGVLPSPSQPVTRPNYPSITPPTTRPSLPNTNLPSTRPSLPNTNLPGTRPSPGTPGVRPGIVPTPQPGYPGTRPSLPNPGIVPRPETPTTRPTPLPSRPGEGNLTRPTPLPGRPGDGNLTRPTPWPTKPGEGGSGIQRPTPLPGRPGDGITTRPTPPWNTRPGEGGGGIQRPTPLPGKPGDGITTRPTPPWNTRPGEGGGIQRPTPLPQPYPNRPGGGGNIIGPGTRPPLPDRPNINQPNWVNRPNIGNSITNNNIHINNNFNTIAPTIYNPNRPWGGYTRPYYGGVYRPYGWANYGNNFMWGSYYTARFYGGWHGGFWNNLWFPPAFVPRPVPLGWLWPAAVNWRFFNPYWYNPPVIVQYVNYSQPIPVATQTFAEAPTDTPVTLNVTINNPPPAAAAAPVVPKIEDEAANEAAKLLDTAREQFFKGEYAAAEKTTDAALAKNPQDPTLHEFRALTLFAQGKFGESAAAIYAVLAAGPGWNAETLYSLYPDKLTFARQLAALEKHAAANPKDASAQFLLGYQYLTLGDKEKAIAAFKAAVAIEPKDEVSKALVDNLTTPPSAEEPKP